MALSGELSDLSLAELIEFFCNQRKTGRLKISYERAPGFFYFQNGMLADAKIGILRGVDAVYYALTLENAQFKFSPSFPPDQRTIHQPWAQVALEGLRRMDEGITPIEAFPAGAVEFSEDGEPIRPDEPELMPEYDDQAPVSSIETSAEPASEIRPLSAPVESTAPLSLMVEANRSGFRRNGIIAAVVAVLLIGAAVGVPAGWYGKRNAPTASAQTEAASAPKGEVQMSVPDETGAAAKTDLPSSTVAEQPKANHEARDRAKAEERARTEAAKATATDKAPAPTAPAAAPKPGPKMVTVQVTYDENGRVTQASGGDATAARIARQRRFPAGKPGSATVSIPMN